MKHTLKITIWLISIFFIAQIMGLLIVNEYMPVKKNVITGKYVFNESNVKELPAVVGVPNERPEMKTSSNFIIYIIVAIVIGTILILILRYFRQPKIWKAWFFLAIVFTLYFAFAKFLEKLLNWLFNLNFNIYVQSFLILVCSVLAYFKIYKPNLYVHNFTEIFIYSGIVAIFVPLKIMNISTALILLGIISIYDMIAVWQSKHMIKLAKFQTESKAFAGLYIPYKLPKKQKENKNLRKDINKKSKAVKAMKVKTAILGGGDIAFPMLFAGTIMKSYGLLQSMIIAVTATIALFLLFYFAKKDKFYPAMPFLTAGCLIGYGLLLLVI